MITEEAPVLSLTFGGGQKQVKNERVSKEIYIGTNKYKTEFYVVKDLQVSFILRRIFK